MSQQQRRLRAWGIRRPFEVGRFVLAVMTYAEELAEAEAAEADPAPHDEVGTSIRTDEMPATTEREAA